MMNSKVTVAANFATVKAFLEANGADATLVAFIDDRMKKASRKSTSVHKVTDEQTAIRNEIVRVLTVNGFPMSIKEMQTASEILAPLSTSKISGNITPILKNGKTPKEDGVISRMVEKKIAKFFIG